MKLKYILLILLSIICIAISFVLCYLTYSEDLYPIALIPIGVFIAAMTQHFKKSTLLTIIIAVLMSVILPILLSDGLLHGDKVSFKYIMIRGITRISYSNPIKSDEKIIETTIPSPDYGEKGYRDTNFTCPDGYEFTQFVTDDGVIMEKLIPEKSNGKVILMVHGGAYIGKLNDIFNNFLVWYSEAADGASVYSVDYKVAPEYGYKDTITDVINAYKYVLSEGYSPEDIVFAGDSAGGGLVIATAMYIRDNYPELQQPRAIFTISGWTNLAMDSKSYTTNRKKDAQFGSNKVLEKSAMMYAKSEDELKNQYISPYYGDFTGLPTLYMQVGNYEMLRDDTVDLVKNAKAQGVDAECKVYGGMFHEFQMIRGMIPEADDAWKDIENFFDSVFK